MLPVNQARDLLLLLLFYLTNGPDYKAGMDRRSKSKPCSYPAASMQGGGYLGAAIGVPAGAGMGTASPCPAHTSRISVPV